MGKRIRKKIKDVEQHKHAVEEERFIVQEMLNNVNKNFYNINDYCINQQLIIHRDLFRRVTLK